MNEVQNRNIFNGLMFKKKRSKKEEKHEQKIVIDK